MQVATAMADEARRGMAVSLTAIVVVCVLSACTKHQADAPAPWSFSQAADGPELSATAAESSFKGDHKDYSPTLRIVCRHGRPNVELEPIYVTYCAGDCSQGGALGFDESFVATADPNPRLADATAKGGNAPLQQDLLSNAPGDIVVTGDAKAGVSQGGEWGKQSGSAVVVRFDYGTDKADAAYVAGVDQQARNFINRLAGSRWFKVSQVGAVARYNTRALGAELPKLWAVCPAPKAR